MKLVSFLKDKSDYAGILVNERVYPFQELDPTLPPNMKDFLLAGESMMQKAKTIDKIIKDGKAEIDGYAFGELKIISPVPHPTSCRDAYAFRQHVATARRNRGVEMIPEFDQFPVFYFTNHQAVYGPGDIELMPDHFHKLDYELEGAIVIGKKGRNVKAAEADQYIAGFMIMNDLSARELQMQEMKLNLGPAKGKDFASSFGPYMVTPDELEHKKTNAKKGHTGNAYDLKMKAYVNGNLYSEGSLSDMDWTFAEIIERCAYGADIHPGDVIGSGTVGTGCLMELNGTGKLNDPDYKPWWLKEGDEVTLEIECLGKLTNKMKKVNTDFSLLELKKNL
jgi:fumarylacetoacetate (FAA) hydrolase